MQRSLVAVTATTREWDGAFRVRLTASYVRALERAGLVPLVVPPLDDPADAERVLDALDGLVLTGGEDVDPARYGAPRHPTVTVVNPARDACEAALTAAARERGLPTLAICRGIQLLNVALGGTLVQDIPSQRPDAIPHNPAVGRSTRAHEVTVDGDSRLCAALGATRLVVNSFHHQAPDAVAPGLRVTARAPDGIIEGLEPAGGDWWMLAVQWHPEELTESPEGWDRGLFAAFAAACEDRAAPGMRSGRSVGGG